MQFDIDYLTHFVQFYGVKMLHFMQFVKKYVYLQSKGSELTHCDNLTLIVMEGETKTLNIEGKTICQVLATDWLLGK